MASVSFTIYELMSFCSACAEMSDAIESEKNSFVSAAETAIGKYESAREIYSQSIEAMRWDENEASLVYEQNLRAIDSLEGKLRDAKSALSSAAEGAKTSAQNEVNNLETALSKAENINSQLDSLRRKLTRRMDEYRNAMRICDDNISSLRADIGNMERSAANAIDVIGELEDAGETAQEYGDRVLELLGGSELSGDRRGIRIKFSDISVLEVFASELVRMSEDIAKGTAVAEEANGNVQNSMRDKITRAAIAKLREIESEMLSGAGALAKLGKNAARAYDYLCEYLSLARTVS